MKALGILLVLALFAFPVSAIEESPGRFQRESSYAHIRELLNPAVVESVEYAHRYAARNGLPSWMWYPGQCDFGFLVPKGDGTVCIRPGGRNLEE